MVYFLREAITHESQQVNKRWGGGGGQEANAYSHEIWKWWVQMQFPCKNPKFFSRALSANITYTYIQSKISRIRDIFHFFLVWVFEVP